MECRTACLLPLLSDEKGQEEAPGSKVSSEESQSQVSSGANESSLEKLGVKKVLTMEQ